MSDKRKTKSFNFSLWLPVTFAFVLLIAAWVTIIVIAQSTSPEQLPPSLPTGKSDSP
tara:strand:- start:8763 stop:8933 length:171 start_codon:yes stop_codon:yes gene_type:complete